MQTTNMRFYITKETIDNIRKSFFPIKNLYLIDPNESIEKFISVKNSECFEFMVNEEIKNKIIYALEKKKKCSVIYVNDQISRNTIEHIRGVLSSRKRQSTLIFIDKIENENEILYDLFDEIIFFPKQKKIKIIECTPIKNPLFYWVNDTSKRRKSRK